MAVVSIVDPTIITRVGRDCDYLTRRASRLATAKRPYCCCSSDTVARLFFSTLYRTQSPERRTATPLAYRLRFPSHLATARGALRWAGGRNLFPRPARQGTPPTERVPSSAANEATFRNSCGSEWPRPEISGTGYWSWSGGEIRAISSCRRYSRSARYLSACDL